MLYIFREFINILCFFFFLFALEAQIICNMVILLLYLEFCILPANYDTEVIPVTAIYSAMTLVTWLL